MNQEKIGKFIRELRTKKRLSQKDLANQLGVTVAAVSKWENGKNIPDISNLKAIAELFEVSLTEIINGEINSAPPSVTNESLKGHNYKQTYYIKLLSIVSVIFCLLIGLSIYHVKNSSPEFIVIDSYYDEPEEIFASLNFKKIYRIIIEFKGNITDRDINEFYQQIISETETTQDLTETDAIFIECYKNYQEDSSYDYFYMYNLK